MYQKTVLDNGLRIVISTMTHTRSVSLAFFVGAGSGYEDDAIAGASHFLEHMLFKGTERRPTAREVSEEIEGIGGIMNAATDKELTVYWAKVGHQHFVQTLDVLTDALRNSRLEPGELEKERQVVIEELSMTEDSPADLVGLMIEEMLWPGQPRGRDAGGTIDSVKGITRQDLVDYIALYYVPANVVLAVAGNVTREQVVAKAEELLGDWEPAPHGTWRPIVDAERPRVRLRSKRTEQAHLCLASPGLSSHDPDRYALDVLNTVLGEGMSSRLFLQIRETLGLAYDVHSYICHFQDTGAAMVGAGVDPKQIVPTVHAIRLELQKIKEPVPARELTKAKEYLKGRLSLRMEDTGAVTSWLGRQELLRNHIRTVDEVLDLLEGVNVGDVEHVASRRSSSQISSS